MTCSDEARILYAYGEPCSREERHHLRACPDCRREVAAFRRISDLYGKRRRPGGIATWASALAAAWILAISPAPLEPGSSWPQGAAVDRALVEIRSGIERIRPAEPPVDAAILSLRARVAQLLLSDDDDF